MDSQQALNALLNNETPSTAIESASLLGTISNPRLNPQPKTFKQIVAELPAGLKAVDPLVYPIPITDEKKPAWKGANGKKWYEEAVRASDQLSLAALQARCDVDRRYARWNAGIVASASTTCQLDCDHPNVAEHVKRDTGRDIPRTFTALSANRKLPHYYFLPTDYSRANCPRSKSTGEFDFWVSKHHTVAPGSSNGKGGTYGVADPSPLVLIPEWLVDWINAQHRAESKISGEPDASACSRLKDAYLKNCNPEDMYGIEGLEIDSQHPTMVSLACFLNDGERDENDIAEILTKLWDEYCARTPAEDEIENIAKHAVGLDPCVLVPREEFQAEQAKKITFGPSAVAVVNEQAKEVRRFSHASLKARTAAEPEPQLIEGMLAEHSIAVLVGDSTIGKTPLAIQMGIAVAAGPDFLGMPVRKGRALVVDYENSNHELASILDALTTFRGVTLPEDSFMILKEPESQKEVFETVAEFKPDIVIVDALRGLDPSAETGNDKTAELVNKLRRFPTAWVLIHHPRKDPTENGNDKKVSLDKAAKVVDWLQNASGARALINQSATRIGVEQVAGGPGDLLLRWNLKAVGDRGPIMVERILDEHGDPAGYQKMAGADLLDDKHQQFLRRLPFNKPMSFGEIQAALAVSRKEVCKFLDAGKDAGVVSSDGKPRSKNRKYSFAEGPSLTGSFNVGFSAT